MAQEGSPTPRRALEPLPEEPRSTRAGGRFAETPEEPSPVTGLRRLAATPASPISPVNPLEVPARTPVPPPAPVLPEPEAGPASAGRRFSASAEPDEFVPAAPRRSAVSPLSPVPAIEPVLPPAPRPTAPPVVTVPTNTPAPTSPFARTPGAQGLSVPTAPSAPAPFGGGSAAGALADAAALDTTPRLTPASLPATTSPGTDQPTLAGPSPAAAAPLSRRERKAAEREAKAAAKRQAAADKAEAKASAVDTVAATSSAAVTAPDATASGGGTAAHPTKRNSRPALIIIASVAAVVLLVAAGVWLLTLRSGASSGSPTTSGTASALDPLLTASDLNGLAGVTWTESTGTSDPGRPICLPATGNGLPNALRTASRKIVDPDANQVMQVVDTYADDATATTAYSVRLAQAGTCADDTVWITGANAITGLADSADAVRLVVQDATNQFHTLLLSRTGRSVNLVDVTTTKSAVKALDLAKVMASALSRQCGGDLGTCPSNPSPSTVPPPAGDPKGWLVEADLPRVTPGEGRWGATDPFTNLATKGSQCEVIDLETVAGTQSAAQRTLLLAGDSKAPQGFGVDVVVYTFAKADAASSLATKLNTNIGKCASRAPTATVVTGPTANGTGDNGVNITGSTYLVTQKSGSTTLGIYRVGVVTVGSKLVYLLANPTSSFDFTDSEWKAIVVRAGQRASQA